MSKVIEIKDESHLRDVLNSPYHLVVLDIYADWCGPCKFLSPKLEELAEQYQYSSILFCKLNQELQLKQVEGLPTIEFWQRKENSPTRELIHTVLGANLSEIKQVLSTVAQPAISGQRVASASSAPPSAPPSASSPYDSQPISINPSQLQANTPVFTSSSSTSQNCMDRNNKRKSQYKSFNKT